MEQSNGQERPKPGIVAGVDGSETALGAVRWAAKEAATRGLTLQVLHAAPYVRPGQPAGPPSPEQRRARAILARGYTVAHRAQPELAPGVELVVAGPAKALVDASAIAELLVVGMSGSGGLDEVVLGSVALEVSGQGRCPVVVVRGRWQDAADGPVTVGVGDDADLPAIGWAFEAASRYGAPLVAVHTSQRGSARRRDPGEASDLLAPLLDPWRERYPSVEVRPLVAAGKPDELLLEHSTRARLVVVGTRARGSAARALLGSTSRALLRHSRCPVAVIRHDVVRGVPEPGTPSVARGERR